METLPLYVPVIFIATTILTLVLFYKATAFSKPVIILTLTWLAIQAALGLSGFYLNESTTPPRFGLVLLPPMVFIATRFLTQSGRSYIDRLDIRTLTLLHITRIPVELTLYWLFVHKAVPQVMTFEGRNFDILCGITAPIVYYFGFVKPVFGRKVLLAWNIICLLVLANIVTTAVLSTPLPFQQFGFEQPNIALFYFPFVWLPGFLVPVVLFSHLVAIRRLMTKRAAPQTQI
ncbi:hypothetical protein [Mucilaginibacter pedocola]|uniref:Uncharacterized protein n=1 Tax=Mucilaginibacter pedocola TaxID=1792845 RepID=A0A1S9PHS1_9SPHI|nr:hypothetical protein [Mucilaginibacter pedocola]OOQ60503.1 hypothetical protein BC343_24735 [Mucilaginibacter pedocola]